MKEERPKNPAAVALGSIGGSKRTPAQCATAKENIKKAWESRRAPQNPPSAKETAPTAILAGQPGFPPHD